MPAALNFTPRGRRSNSLKPSSAELERRKTVVYVTHSIEEALLLGDRCVLMTAQPGRIKQIIDVPFGHPRNLITLAADAGFGKLKLDIWRVLEEEVTRARAEVEG